MESVAMNGHTPTAVKADNTCNSKPLTIGVFGGSFNPIHLGHALLAITVQQTTCVDQVVLVPVYKHAVKTDLLPFSDRVSMCRLAVAAFGSDVTVSTIEEDVGESNGAMLRALKLQYPENTKFLWICGDDFFRWMDRPKGLETVAEVSGLIVQRRLHRHDDEQNVFFKEPVDEARVRAVAVQMDLEIDYIYGELPHFSSTLVRRAPGHWRSFLTQTVIQYLDERPHLLNQLIANLEADAQAEEQESSSSEAKTTEDVDDHHRPFKPLVWRLGSSCGDWKPFTPCSTNADTPGSVCLLERGMLSPSNTCKDKQTHCSRKSLMLI